MRKSLLLLCLIALMLGVVMAQAQDGGENEPIYGLISVDNADVRSGPDFAYPSIGRLPRNASIIVTGRSGDFFRRWDGRQWLRVNYGDREAWIYARLVRTSIAFNSIPPVGRLLPRDRNGRVPEGFDLAGGDICAPWVGTFTQSAGVISESNPEITVTYPGLQGANVYSVIVISPTGFRTAFDSETTTATIEFDRLPRETGTYTWRVAPYWTDAIPRFRWQQVCLLQTGGTFEKPE